MNWEGDGREGQPADDAASIDDILGLMDEEEGDGGALDESEEGDESDESEDEEDDDEGQQDEPTVTLKHDGKEFTLKQSEVVDLAQKGYDYTQKTMAVAKDREAVEAEKAKVSEVRQKLDGAVGEQVARLQAIEQFMASQLGSPPPAEWASQDVAYYIAQKEQYEARKGQLEEARNAITQLQQEQARQRQAWIAQQAEATERALRDTLPGWNDNTLNELVEYAGKAGIDQRNADSVLLQKGFWELAHKAKAYDALLAKKAEQKPVSKLQKVTSPKAANQPSQLAQRQVAMKRHKARPSLATLGALMD